MSDTAGEVIPFWTLTTRDTDVPAVLNDDTMTPARLEGLRSALAAFADAPVDVAVVEVGLGGRWDATNVADGAVAPAARLRITGSGSPARWRAAGRRPGSPELPMA